jgi:hypothetical protein
MTTPDLTSLRERVASLAGADREVDALVCAALRYSPYPEDDAIPPEAKWQIVDTDTVEVRCDQPHGYWLIHAPPLTSSLDAVVALVEKVLPGSGISVGRDRDGATYGSVRWGDGVDDVALCRAATPALALFSALLASVDGKER